MAEVTFDRDSLTATVTMKDDKSAFTKQQANKALVAKGDRFKVDSFSEKK